MFKDISSEFHSSMQVVSTAVLLTLSMRPIGALLFGRLADRFGPQAHAGVEHSGLFDLGVALRIRAKHDYIVDIKGLVRHCDGGEWGVGSALTMETIDPSARGFVSGLAAGRLPSGYFLASGPCTCYMTHWAGATCSCWCPYRRWSLSLVRRRVDESPTWRQPTDCSPHKCPESSTGATGNSRCTASFS